MTRRSTSVLAAVLLLFALGSARVATAQSCANLGTQSTTLPGGSGTLPPNGDMYVGTNYLYVQTQWGFARAPLTTPSNPAPYAKIVVGKEGGSQEGIIPIMCDCHQGWNVMDVAEAPDGTARMIGDWQPYAQGGPPPPPPNTGFSGLPAMLAQANGTGNPTFGQQVNLSARVPIGGRIAAIYTGSKYFAYFPTKSGDVYKADITSPTGDPSYQNPIEPSPTSLGWSSTASLGVRLRAKHVSIPGYDAYILVGALPS
jgi:hypothetical protein